MIYSRDKVWAVWALGRPLWRHVATAHAARSVTRVSFRHSHHPTDIHPRHGHWTPPFTATAAPTTASRPPSATCVGSCKKGTSTRWAAVSKDAKDRRVGRTRSKGRGGGVEVEDMGKEGLWPQLPDSETASYTHQPQPFHRTGSEQRVLRPVSHRRAARQKERTYPMISIHS